MLPNLNEQNFFKETFDANSYYPNLNKIIKFEEGLKRIFGGLFEILIPQFFILSLTQIR